jgi:hypothetical protein
MGDVHHDDDIGRRWVTSRQKRYSYKVRDMSVILLF